jgi:glycosyltransferase involved in cell wall biosynthesis
MYDLVFVTHIPVFYKVNLYNEISKNKSIFVVFIAENTSEIRTKDFVPLDNALFDFTVLNSGVFQCRNTIISCYALIKCLSKLAYKRIVVSGWDLPEFWFVVALVSKLKVSLALESTVNESKATGLTGIIKKMFLAKVSLVFASGKLHCDLLSTLSYDGEARITNGVGIINKPKFVPSEKKYSKKFLFVGRLSEEKNIVKLVSVFNDLSDYQLTVIGVGPLEDKLNKLALNNIKMLGSIDNKNLPAYYLENDFLILPSAIEPWGLVVEESLYFGTPVIVSEQCGCSVLIVNGSNGFTFDSTRFNSLRDLLIEINIERYEKLKLSNLDIINDKDIQQASCYEQLS